MELCHGGGGVVVVVVAVVVVEVVVMVVSGIFLFLVFLRDAYWCNRWWFLMSMVLV